MEIVIENVSMADEEFHQLISGETGDALRQTAKNYLGSQGHTENELARLKAAGGRSMKRCARP